MAVVERGKLLMPDLEDELAVEMFLEDVSNFHQGRKGVTKLRQYINKYRHTRAILTSHAKTIAGTVNYLNGVRSSREVTTVDSAYRKYLGMVSTGELRKQCDVHGVDFNAYEDIDSIINALVDRQTYTV